ncbi:hypothetical protein DMENIID0001_022820 [Sergentomyia squamirostris]
MGQAIESIPFEAKGRARAQTWSEGFVVAANEDGLAMECASLTPKRALVAEVSFFEVHPTIYIADFLISPQDPTNSRTMFSFALN